MTAAMTPDERKGRRRPRPPARLLLAAGMACALGLLLLARRAGREGVPRTWKTEFHPAGDACDTDWLDERPQRPDRLEDVHDRLAKVSWPYLLAVEDVEDLPRLRAMQADVVRDALGRLR